MHLIILKWLKRQIQTEEKNNETRRCWSEKRNCLQKCFHLLKYIIHHENVCFFFLISLWTWSKSLINVDSLHHFMWFLYYLMYLFSSDGFVALPYKLCLRIFEFFKNHPQGKVFCNVNLSNLENNLQKNLTTEKDRECSFRAFGGTNFENVLAWHQAWRCLQGFNVYQSHQGMSDTSLIL